MDIQEISENQYHVLISLDEKLHIYLLKIRNISKKSISAAMFNHQQVIRSLLVYLFTSLNLCNIT